MVDVPQVQLETLGPRRGVAAVDLGPTGDAGHDLVAPGLSWGIPGHVLHQQRSRADETHLALHDVQQLRQLVKTPASQRGTEPREALPVGKQVSARVPLRRHRAELDQRERSAPKTRPLVAKQDRRALDHAKHQRDTKQQRGQEHESHGAEHDVGPALAVPTIERGRVGASGAHLRVSPWRQKRTLPSLAAREASAI